MSDVTVQSLADFIGIPQAHLLECIREAGLPQRRPDAAISEQDKQILLRFLRVTYPLGEPSEVCHSPRYYIL